MRRLVVDHYGTTCVVLNSAGLKTALVSRATRAHERRQMMLMQSPTIPADLAEYFSWRLAVISDVVAKAIAP